MGRGDSGRGLGLAHRRELLAGRGHRNGHGSNAHDHGAHSRSVLDRLAVGDHRFRSRTVLPAFTLRFLVAHQSQQRWQTGAGRAGAGLRRGTPQQVALDELRAGDRADGGRPYSDGGRATSAATRPEKCS